MQYGILYAQLRADTGLVGPLMLKTDEISQNFVTDNNK
jgi:hypothetical protein